MEPSRPRAAALAVAFFAVSGALELGLAFLDERAPTMGTLWEALGRALLHWLLAAGLWRGLALCRRLALVYALAALLTYACVLGLALAAAPVRFPPSVIVQSLFQVPSCLLLLPWLRTSAAIASFPRRLV